MSSPDRPHRFAPLLLARFLLCRLVLLKLFLQVIIQTTEGGLLQFLVALAGEEGTSLMPSTTACLDGLETPSPQPDPQAADLVASPQSSGYGSFVQ